MTQTLEQDLPFLKIDSISPLIDYLVLTNDNDKRLWFLLENKPSPVLADTIRIGSQTNSYYIVDQFAGRQPAVIDLQSARLHKFSPETRFISYFTKTAVLDSNETDDLVRYVGDRNSFRSTPAGKSTRELLNYFVAGGWDYNPVWYYLESVLHAKWHDSWPHIARTVRSMIALDTMDRDQFLNTGEIRADQSAIKDYLQKHDVKSLQDAVALQVSRPNTSSLRRSVSNLLLATYATLLKAAIISQQKASPAKKLSTGEFYLMRISKR